MKKFSKEKIINNINLCFESILGKADFDVVILAQPHNCAKIIEAFGDIAKPYSNGSGAVITKYLSGLPYNIFVYTDSKKVSSNDIRMFTKAKCVSTMLGHCITLESYKFIISINSLYK